MWANLYASHVCTWDNLYAARVCMWDISSTGCVHVPKNVFLLDHLDHHMELEPLRFGGGYGRGYAPAPTLS